MASTFRRQIIVYLLDLLICLTVFFFSRYIDGEYPRWYWLVTSCAVWAGIGIVSQKLAFEKFRKVRYAIFSIIAVDILTYILLYIVWVTAFPQRNITPSAFFPLPILIVAEAILYYIFRRLVLRKIPYLYEEIIAHDSSEKAMETGIKLDDVKRDINPDLKKIYHATKGMKWDDAKIWILENQNQFAPDTIIVDSLQPESILADPMRDPKFIVCLHAFNDARHFNTFLSYANYKLIDGGSIMLHGNTAGMRREKIRKSNPYGLRSLMILADYVWSRVFPKMSVTRWFYMLVSGGKNRCFPRVEILGRISRAGFTIVDDEIRHGEYFVSAVKTARPVRLDKPSYGPLIRLRRVGYHGDLIGVYKFRTMYAYSEYLQSYVYQQVGLQDGGKFNHDFRVNVWGKILRAVWLDELPMIYNWIKGDMKLVGVRPLSQHYYSLYTPEMQALRITVKPGLFPPFYYEKKLPKTIEDVQESERRYIEAYKKSPFMTDLRYLFGTLFNIMVRKKHSN